MKVRVFVPALILGLAVVVAACGGTAEAPDAPDATSTPTVDIVGETPGARYPPVIETVPHTPAPVTPVLAAERRSDCPPDWYVYDDPEGYFSICYPPDWSARVGGSPRRDFGHILTLESPRLSGGLGEQAVRLTMYWTETSPYALGIIDDRCEPVSHWRDIREVTLHLAGRQIIACVGEELMRAPETGPVRATFAEIPLRPEQGYVVFFLKEPANNENNVDGELLSSMFASLQVSQ